MRRSHSKLRKWIQTNPRIGGAAAVAASTTAIVLFVVCMTNGHTPAPLVERVYFYDLGTGQLFAASSSAIAPIEAPSGKLAGVRAFVFACESCDDTGDRTVAYLQVYSSAAKRRLESATPVPPDDPTVLMGNHVSPADSPAWVPAASRQGAAIMTPHMLQCPGGKPAKTCFPD